MAASPKRVVWDACSWIALIQREKLYDSAGVVTEDRYQMCRGVIAAAEAGAVEILTSGLALVEVCKHPKIAAGGDPALIKAYFDHDYVLVVPLDTYVGEIGRELMMRGYAGLKPPDASYLATAIGSNVDTVHTFDGDLLNLTQKLQTKSGVLIDICKPDMTLKGATLWSSP